MYGGSNASPTDGDLAVGVLGARASPAYQSKEAQIGRTSGYAMMGAVRNQPMLGLQPPPPLILGAVSTVVAMGLPRNPPRLIPRSHRRRWSLPARPHPSSLVASTILSSGTVLEGALG